MAKSTKKTPEQKAADLKALIGAGGVSTLEDLTKQSAGTHNELEGGPSNEIEQEGKRAPATPAVVVADTSADLPDSSTAIPEPSLQAATKPEIAAASEQTVAPVAESSSAPAPAPTPIVAEAPVTTPEVEQPITRTEAPSSAIEPESELEAEVETPNTGDDFDLSLLFKPNPPGSKKATCRLTGEHHQYLLTLGALLGDGMSPPEIVYNLVEHFITTQDKKVKKAIAKQLRLGRAAGPASYKKS